MALSAIYNGTAISFTQGSVAAVSGEAFPSSQSWYVRDNLASTSFPAIAGATITCGAWLNAANLTGHPTDGDPWTVAVGLMFTSTSAVQSYVTAATLVPGSTWTYVTGTITVPANAAIVTPWLQINCTTGTESATYYALAADVTYVSSFNGWNIVPMPTSPAPRQIDFDITDAVAMLQSPFNLATQMQVWPGAESITANVSLPAISGRQTPAIVAAWTAWLRGLQGILNVFPLGDPNHATPNGSVAGAPLVNGTSIGYNLPGSYSLFTKNWTPNSSNVLVVGDYIQIGYRLHSVTQSANSDNNGQAVLSIWPSIREEPGDGQPIVTSNCQGLFRLADNKRSWTEHASKAVGFNFKCVEAR